MKLRIEQLSAYLQENGGNNGATGAGDQQPRVFFLSGDEPLQMMEAADQIRQYARSSGFVERDIVSMEGAKADWSPLLASCIELSLFSQKKMLDVRLSGSQPGVNGSKALREYVERMPADQFLLLQTGKLDKNSRNSAWVKALDKCGVMIQVWELSPAQNLAWVAKRLRDNGLQASQDAVKLLTERVEGNLLAADQEIKKLALLHAHTNHEIDTDIVMQSVADSSRFNVFDLSDAVLLGDLKRLHHIITLLREEDTPLPLILWSLATLSRQLHDMCRRVSAGESIMQVVQIAGYIPKTRQALFPAAIRRLQGADWSAILHRVFRLETLSKGQTEIRIRDESRIWDTALDVAILLSGKSLLNE